jgi:hypothetical protein
MNCVIRVTFSLIVPTFFLSMVVPRATAQNAEGYLVECEGTNGKERERCVNRVTSSGIVLPMVFGGNAVARAGDFHLRLVQLRYDLNYLEIASRYLVRAAYEGDNLNLKAVAKAAGEIKKRTERLRTLLALPASEQSEDVRPTEVPAELPQLQAAILKLSFLITNARRNTVLRGRILDQRQSAMAQQDLDAIVELSERIKTSCKVIIKNER